MTSIWIARDEDKRLFVYFNEPFWNKYWSEWKSEMNAYKEIDKQQFPEIKPCESKEFELKEVVR